MNGESRYCYCGQVLSPHVTDAEVTRHDGVSVTFRRHTDFVVCPGCVAFYRVADVRDGWLRGLNPAALEFLDDMVMARSARLS